MEFNPFNTQEPEAKPVDKLLKEIQKILAEAGSESNIPVSHDYWKLCNEYRRMTAK